MDQKATEKNDAGSEGGWLGFGNVEMAKGYNHLGTARGTLVMANVFLSTALIYLASEQVGCVQPNDSNTKMEVVEECHERVFGTFKPAALITNVAVVSGILGAFFMPLAGAIVDYTSHRWTIGVVSAGAMTLIQFVQIWTNRQTWFATAILQAIQGCFYQIHILASYSYLSTMSRSVSEQAMANFSSTFTMVQFGSQALFIITVVAISMILDLDDVQTAQLSQAINSINILISFTLGWRLLPKIPPQNVLEEGSSLLWQGFRQNYNTAVRINRDYRRSLRWFLLGCLFAEPAVMAFTLVAVVYLNDQLHLSSTEIGLFFFTVLIAMVPGGILFRSVARYSNALGSVQFSMWMLFFMTAFAGTVLTEDNAMPLVYIWGFVVGVMLGVYYPGMKLFFSLVVPHGQEAEITGFYVYCTQILVWLPPLIFSTMVEADIDQGMGVMALGVFFLIAIAIFSMAAPFDELLAEIHGPVVNDDDKAKSTADPVSTSSFQLAGPTGEVPSRTTTKTPTESSGALI